jgi:hypothetical protein
MGWAGGAGKIGEVARLDTELSGDDRSPANRYLGIVIS